MSRFPLRVDGPLLLLGIAPRDTAGEPRARTEPDWIQADPRRIRAALARASAKPSGGWVVLDATRTLRERGPQRYTLGGRELVGWWAGSEPRVAPDACPHMGASLSCGRVDGEGRLVCPWHGLPLGAARHGGWAPLRAHDDGVLTWVRLPSMLAPGESPTEAPVLAARPKRFLDAVVRTEARCAPEDVIANRLDPWHGAHFHPHSFARLRVVGEDDESITVRVVYRIVGRVGMEVDARFHCPDPRTIVMTIVAGEGVGSVVETHATPIAPDRTAVIEATLASSARPGLAWLPRAGTVLRGLVRARAARLWADDAAYCERTYELRTRKRALPIAEGVEPEEPIEAE
jgi:hypothetical protein